MFSFICIVFAHDNDLYNWPFEFCCYLNYNGCCFYPPILSISYCCLHNFINIAVGEVSREDSLREKLFINEFKGASIGSSSYFALSHRFVHMAMDVHAKRKAGIN